MDISIDTTYKFLGSSVAGTATKNTTTSIDYLLEGSWIIYGAELLYKDAAWGDYIAFQVVDKDNVLGFGANTVLNEWIEKWYIDPLSSRWRVTSELGSTIPEGVYIRLKYTSMSATTDVGLAVNFFMIRT